MKKFLHLLMITFLLFANLDIAAQCASGFSQARMKWDNLDYFYNSGNGIAPYGFSGGNYVSYAMEQSQTFGLGTTSVNFMTSATAMVKGKNTRHTGNILNYGGADAHFIPSANNQTITLSFATEVIQPSFTLYDLDGTTSFTVQGFDAANVLQPFSTATQPGTILTIVPNSGSPVINSAAGDQANNLNTGTVTLSGNGRFKTIRITINTIGTDPKFWFSDLYACVPGSFPLNYHQMPEAKPFTGQPDYVLTTADNNSVYKIDPATGRAWFLFAETTSPYINSFAYDQVNHILYYTTDGTSAPQNNKQLKKYDFNTNTTSVVFANLSTALNLPSFDQGLESAAAAFYDGKLYLGVEGGKFYNTNQTRYSIIYRLDLNATGTPVKAAQVFATQAYDSTNGTAMHDWGDFLVKDGSIIDFNTARQGTTTFTYPRSSFIHYDLMTGAVVQNYVNPSPTLPYGGQAGLNWAGNLYSFRNVIQNYNMTGGLGTSVPITVVRGPAWRGSAGDASEPYKPKSDFGDAPASYDPAGSDPAVHEMDSSLRIGSGFDIEWVCRGQTALADADNFDDGISAIPVLSTSDGSYRAIVSVFNNTGASATVCAWLDWNGNGSFDVMEGITRSIPSSNTQQTLIFDWNGILSTISNGGYTYLRVRIAYGSSTLSALTPTGYFDAGEVEDYRIPVSRYPLASAKIGVEAIAEGGGKVLIVWKVENEENVGRYMVERSVDGQTWKQINTTLPALRDSNTGYRFLDPSPFEGVNYYRIIAEQKNGSSMTSEIRKVELAGGRFYVSSGHKQLTVHFKSQIGNTPGRAEIINTQGNVLFAKEVVFRQGSSKLDLPSGALRSGLYIIRFSSTSRQYSQAVVLK